MASDRIPPTLQALIGAGIATALADRITACPARVVRYDAATQQVDCQPLVKVPYIDETGARQVRSLPVVTGVPVIFPGGGGYRVTFPITANDRNGDVCLLVVSSLPLDRWLTGFGVEVDPEIDDGGELHHAVAIVGLHTFGAPLASCPTDGATFGKDGSGGVVKVSGDDVTVNGGVDAVARVGDSVKIIPVLAAGKLAIWMSQVEIAINAVSAGAVTPLSGTFVDSPGLEIKTGASNFKA